MQTNFYLTKNASRNGNIFLESKLKQALSEKRTIIKKVQKVLFWGMMVLFSYFAKAGNSCSSADSVPVFYTHQQFVSHSFATSQSWFKFNPDTSAITISFRDSLGTSELSKISNIKVYNGSCSSLVLQFDSNYVNDSSLFVKISSLNRDSVYFLKLTKDSSFSGNNIVFSLYNGLENVSLPLQIESPNCQVNPNMPCKGNLVCNPGFEENDNPPSGDNQVTTNCHNWGSPIFTTPDYFTNDASLPAFSVPINVQTSGQTVSAFQGNSYVGIAAI
jgi:hypothetical protein